MVMYEFVLEVIDIKMCLIDDLQLISIVMVGLISVILLVVMVVVIEGIYFVVVEVDCQIKVYNVDIMMYLNFEFD